jgi:hypothetical protein
MSRTVRVREASVSSTAFSRAVWTLMHCQLPRPRQICVAGAGLAAARMFTFAAAG